MKKTLGLAAFLTLAGFLVVAAASAEEGAAQSTRPPTNLKKVGDHWTAWDPPPAGPDDYIIQKGDTLWDLGQQWLGNPFLWPQIWDQNRYVQDSHWIYPGDPIVKPGKATVVPVGGPPPGEVGAEEEPATVPPPKRAAAPAKAAAKPLLPLARSHDVYCSGYIDPDHKYPPLWVAGREMERIEVATGDVVYLSQGRNQGIEPGMDLAVQRKAWTVTHPATGQALGNMVLRLGKVRVLCSHENTAIGVVMDSCEPIRDSDELVPWTELGVPDRTTMPPFDRYCGDASGGVRGYVVTIKDRLNAAGTGHIIHTDLGDSSGVRPGDFLTLYRDNGELPRMMIGQAMILTVEPGTSTAKVTSTVREIVVGDRAEVTPFAGPARASR